MRNTKTHSATYKRRLNKCRTIFYAHSQLQYKYGEQLDERKDIVEIKCNVPMACNLDGGKYTTDFLCTKTDGSRMVRECVSKDRLLKPLTIKCLDASRSYWLSQGISDWGIVLCK